ncbi:MAG: response regulator [Bacteroidota bacterium]
MLDKKDTKPNPVKELVARHIRAADVLSKEGRFEEAMFEVKKALEFDPKNYYARSFEERLRQRLEKTEQKASMASISIQENMEKKSEEVARLLRNADQYIEYKQYKLALEEIAKVYAIDAQNYYASAYSDRIEMLMAQESETKRVEAAQPQKVVEQPRDDAGESRSNLSMYKELLREMLFDGKLKQEELQELASVRAKFNIPDTEHAELEKQVKIDAYVEALRIAWRDGVITKNENQVLEIMRRKYEITMEEHMSAEAKILWAKVSPHAKGTILLVDDERSLLLSLALQLRNHGYDVVTAESPSQALSQMQQQSPSLILSDLMFGEGEMTGMEFYHQVRSILKLKDIPFLLMSGISDEFVVRAGLRMGVDSFIKKPYSLDLLLATMEGKLASRA